MKYFLWLLRIVVGGLFIFSGLIKANDPLGLSYKMNEFFEVWGTHFLMPYSLALSVVMIAFEIIAGVAVILGYAYRVFSFLLLLLITFFTFLTAYVLFSGKIKECGCFGDCIKITNQETFWKDVALLVMILILFVYRNRVKPIFSGYPSVAILVLTAFFAFGIQWWTLEHLPFWDCLPFKKGVNINVDNKIPPGAKPDRYESIMIYKKDGVEKEFTMENYPWQDTTWVFVDRKDKLVEKGNAEPKIRDYIITDYDGNDRTEQILTAPGYTWLLYIKDPGKARHDNFDRIRQLAQEANQQNIPFYVLISADKASAEQYQKEWHFENMQFLVLDVTVSKTALRSNPGLMLLEQGVIKGKWSFRDYPNSIADVKQ
ncbi:BT_3928 family protein [Polluticoccus soli]|uniref:BT_3928 family protein n=1 Tax=Polluticoccus soli TaxID=3034150 RepID=UPI0023E15F77|nr:BT_3928 family protein [Flavipsychrobacter sp. JY13-12]